MPVFRWGHPWIDFQDFEREVDQILHNMNLTFQGVRFSQQYPALNLYELEDEFLLTAELPGLKAEDLEITTAAGMLTLQGERTAPENISEEKFRRRERFLGAWQRTVSLPDQVEEEGLRAEFQHGVLTIHLPKAAATQPRQIPVSEGDH